MTDSNLQLWTKGGKVIVKQDLTGVKAVLCDCCPCPMYAKAIVCSTLTDGTSAVVPYDWGRWSVWRDVVQVWKCSDGIYLENPYARYSNTEGQLKKLKDCTEYSAQQVYGKNAPSPDGKTTEKAKIVILSPIFEDKQKAADWGKEWNRDQWGMLICATCECRCMGVGIRCAPDKYKVSFHGTATTTRSYQGDGYSNITTVETTLDQQHKEIPVSHDHCSPNPDGSGIHGYWGYIDITDITTENGNTKKPFVHGLPMEMSFGWTEDCKTWNPPSLSTFPGYPSPSWTENWPNGKTPDNPENWGKYWTLPAFNPKKPWPTGTWILKYDETEHNSYDGFSSAYSLAINIEITITTEPADPKPPAEASGCKGTATIAAGMPLLIPANFRKFYNMLSEDLK